MSIRIDLEGMTLDINGVREDLNCSEFYEEADNVMEQLVDCINDWATKYDMEIQELESGYYMIENEEHLSILGYELEEILEGIMSELEEEEE